MSESLSKKIDKIIADYVENLQDLQAVALANNDKKEVEKISKLLKKWKNIKNKNIKGELLWK